MALDNKMVDDTVPMAVDLALTFARKSAAVVGILGDVCLVGARHCNPTCLMLYSQYRAAVSIHSSICARAERIVLHHLHGLIHGHHNSQETVRGADMRNPAFPVGCTHYTLVHTGQHWHRATFLSCTTLLPL